MADAEKSHLFIAALGLSERGLENTRHLHWPNCLQEKWTYTRRGGGRGAELTNDVWESISTLTGLKLTRACGILVGLINLSLALNKLFDFFFKIFKEL